MEGPIADAVSNLTEAIKQQIRDRKDYKSQLTQLQETVSRINPFLKDMEKINQNSGGPVEEFTNRLKHAKKVVLEGKNYKGNIFNRSHKVELDSLNESLLRFFKIYVQMHRMRDTMEVLKKLKDIQQWFENFCWKGGYSSSGVPSLEGQEIIGFENQVKYLKGKLLKDPEKNICTVVVVSAPGGYGKTALVTKVCIDPEILERFGSNIYFASVSKDPNMQDVIRNLLPTSPAGKQAQFVSDEDAIHKWRSFLNDENKRHVLLVLDDVPSHFDISKFEFASRGYKILVTSEITFKQYDKYPLSPLEDEDAMNLLCYSVGGAANDNDIPDDLLNQLIKCCKNNPLALTVVGGLLKDAHVDDWQSMLNKLSEGPQSILDLKINETTRLRLATCFV